MPTDVRYAEGNWGLAMQGGNVGNGGDGDFVAHDGDDAARLFRALNRLLHDPSADARRQAEDALRRHRVLDPAWWDDAAVSGPGLVASTTASYVVTRR